MISKTVEIIIISYNCCDLTLNCIDSVYSTTSNINFGITVVDNASSDSTVAILKEKYPEVKIIANTENVGYGAAANKGARTSDSPYIIISNADVTYHDGSIEKLINFLEQNPEIGVVSPQQQYPDGSWQYSWGDYPGIKAGIKDLLFIRYIRHFINKLLWKKFEIHKKPFIPGYLDGAVLAFRKKAFILVKGFDEDFFFYSEETDLCYRLSKARWKTVFLPDVLVTHIRGGASSQGTLKEQNINMLAKSSLMFCKKHLSRYSTLAYVVMEIIHLSAISTFLGLCRYITSGNLKLKLMKKFDYFSNYTKAWKNNYRELSNGRSL